MPSDVAEPVCAPPRKRGRPADSPLVKVAKAMHRAEKRKKDAKRSMFKERVDFNKGAMWDAPSVAERAKKRILAKVDKVLRLQTDY